MTDRRSRPTPGSVKEIGRSQGLSERSLTDLPTTAQCLSGRVWASREQTVSKGPHAAPSPRRGPDRIGATRPSLRAPGPSIARPGGLRSPSDYRRHGPASDRSGSAFEITQGPVDLLDGVCRVAEERQAVPPLLDIEIAGPTTARPLPEDVPLENGQDAEVVKDELPAAVRWVGGSSKLGKPTLRSRRSMTVSIEVPRRPPGAIDLPDHEPIAGPLISQVPLQARRPGPGIRRSCRKRSSRGPRPSGRLPGGRGSARGSRLWRSRSASRRPPGSPPLTAGASLPGPYKCGPIVRP